jgi:hypothetical protein
MLTQYGDTEIITGAKRTPSGPSLCSRPGAGQQGGKFVAAGGSGLQHRPIDVAFDGAYRQSQSLSDFAAGQSLTDQHHDLAFPIGQRQGPAGLTLLSCAIFRTSLADNALR